jgi:hypothetical protein
MARIIDADQMESDELRTFLKESRAEAAAAPAPAPATTPAAPAPAAPQPTKAMLEGKEYSQTQFEGMEPIYEGGSANPRDRGEFLGYGYKYSQLPGYGMVPVYSQPELRGMGPDRSSPPVLLGYNFNPIAAGLGKEDAPKPAGVLAEEKRLGTTMEPLYQTYTEGGGGRRGGGESVEYGPPIGYRYDNGHSQYVNFDANGTYQNTQTRTSAGDQFRGIALSMLSIVYPPAAPFIQAYNAVKAIDSGDTLGFILNAAGASAKIPGLDASTTKLLNDVSTGARIVQAVESKDPLKILSATSGIPGVDPDIKDLSIILNTGNALKNGNIAGAINGISKMSDRDSVGRLTDRLNDIAAGKDVAAISADQVAAFNPPTAEQLAQEQADREQAAREAVRASEKSIEDTLTESGLVTDTQELAPVTVSEKAIPQDDLSFTGSTGNNRVTDSSLPVNPNVGGNILAPVTVTGKKITEEESQALDPVYINAKRDDLIPLEQMPPLPDNTVKEVIAGTPQEPKPTIPTIPKLPTTPATSAKPATSPTASISPTEQFYQTTTQGQPTTLADIKYFLDISGEDILPPKTQSDHLESLLNQSSQPMSLDDLLRHLRS